MPTFTTSDGAAIHYEIDRDDGRPVLLFSNSLGTHLGMWDDQLEAARRNFRVLRYDSRGHGRSAAPEGPYDIERLGRDAVELLDEVGVDRAYFCGLSKGGMVGMWLGVNAPDRIERMAIASTAPALPPADLWQSRMDTALTKGMTALVDGVLERWFTAAFRSREPETVERIKAMILATDTTGYAGCCAMIRDMDQTGDIAAIDLPVLVVAGEHDPATPPARVREVHEAIAGSRFVLLPACAHLSNIEQAARFNETVIGFLKE
jgi:3-oxoadipate enol-lactonase